MFKKFLELIFDDYNFTYDSTLINKIKNMSCVNVFSTNENIYNIFDNQYNNTNNEIHNDFYIPDYRENNYIENNLFNNNRILIGGNKFENLKNEFKRFNPNKDGVNPIFKDNINYYINKKTKEYILEFTNIKLRLDDSINYNVDYIIKVKFNDYEVELFMTNETLKEINIDSFNKTSEISQIDILDVHYFIFHQKFYILMFCFIYGITICHYMYEISKLPIEYQSRFPIIQNDVKISKICRSKDITKYYYQFKDNVYKLFNKLFINDIIKYDSDLISSFGNLLSNRIATTTLVRGDCFTSGFPLTLSLLYPEIPELKNVYYDFINYYAEKFINSDKLTIQNVLEKALLYKLSCSFVNLHMTYVARKIDMLYSIYSYSSIYNLYTRNIDINLILESPHDFHLLSTNNHAGFTIKQNDMYYVCDGNKLMNKPYLCRLSYDSSIDDELTFKVEIIENENSKLHVKYFNNELIINTYLYDKFNLMYDDEKLQNIYILEFEINNKLNNDRQYYSYGFITKKDFKQSRNIILKDELFIKIILNMLFIYFFNKSINEKYKTIEIDSIMEPYIEIINKINNHFNINWNIINMQNIVDKFNRINKFNKNKIRNCEFEIKDSFLYYALSLNKIFQNHNNIFKYINQKYDPYDIDSDRNKLMSDAIRNLILFNDSKNEMYQYKKKRYSIQLLFKDKNLKINNDNQIYTQIVNNESFNVQGINAVYTTANVTKTIPNIDLFIDFYKSENLKIFDDIFKSYEWINQNIFINNDINYNYTTFYQDILLSILIFIWSVINKKELSNTFSKFGLCLIFVFLIDKPCNILFDEFYQSILTTLTNDDIKKYYNDCLNEILKLNFDNKIKYYREIYFILNSFDINIINNDKLMKFNFNKIMEELQEAVKSNISDITNNLNTVTNNINDFNNKISDIMNKISDVNSNLDVVTNRINNLEVNFKKNEDLTNRIQKLETKLNGISNIKSIEPILPTLPTLQIPPMPPTLPTLQTPPTLQIPPMPPTLPPKPPTLQIPPMPPTLPPKPPNLINQEGGFDNLILMKYIIYVFIILIIIIIILIFIKMKNKIFHS